MQTVCVCVCARATHNITPAAVLSNTEQSCTVDSVILHASRPAQLVCVSAKAGREACRTTLSTVQECSVLRNNINILLLVIGIYC